jgi:hypothetical protein
VGQEMGSASVLVVLDDRISRDRGLNLTRNFDLVRQNFKVELFQGQDVNEEQILQKIKKTHYDLILLPIHRYISWIKVEGALGMTRTSGPTVAGYLSETTPFFKIPSPASYLRRIILDFSNVTPSEILLLVRSLCQDTHRSGLKPLLHDTQSPIYCESWYGSQGLGTRIDHILALPEIAQSDWIKRSSAIRIILSAFWGMIYEEGPGKAHRTQGASADVAKAYFQLGISPQCLSFRLYYYTIPHLTPQDAIKQFWPNADLPTKPAQLILRYSDMTRIHTIQETSDMEVVSALFQSASAEKNPEHARTIWIEPLSAKLISEPPYEAPSPQAPHLKALPSVSVSNPKLRVIDTPSPQLLHDASSKIIELKKKVDEREETIRELKSGGIGSSTPLPPPDPESLLEAFQQRYFDARYQIRQFELQIEQIQNKGGSAEELETLRQKMDALANREKAWIKTLMKTLETYRDANQKKPKNNGK